MAYDDVRQTRDDIAERQLREFWTGAPALNAREMRWRIAAGSVSRYVLGPQVLSASDGLDRLFLAKLLMVRGLAWFDSAASKPLETLKSLRSPDAGATVHPGSRARSATPSSFTVEETSWLNAHALAFSRRFSVCSFLIARPLFCSANRSRTGLKIQPELRARSEKMGQT